MLTIEKMWRLVSKTILLLINLNDIVIANYILDTTEGKFSLSSYIYSKRLLYMLLNVFVDAIECLCGYQTIRIKFDCIL